MAARVSSGATQRSAGMLTTLGLDDDLDRAEVLILVEILSDRATVPARQIAPETVFLAKAQSGTSEPHSGTGAR
jgi:hypothetical protein